MSRTYRYTAAIIEGEKLISAFPIHARSKARAFSRLLRYTEELTNVDRATLMKDLKFVVVKVKGLTFGRIPKGSLYAR